MTAGKAIGSVRGSLICLPFCPLSTQSKIWSLTCFVYTASNKRSFLFSVCNHIFYTCHQRTVNHQQQCPHPPPVFQNRANSLYCSCILRWETSLALLFLFVSLIFFGGGWIKLHEIMCPAA